MKTCSSEEAFHLKSSGFCGSHLLFPGRDSATEAASASVCFPWQPSLLILYFAFPPNHPDTKKPICAWRVLQLLLPSVASVTAKQSLQVKKISTPFSPKLFGNYCLKVIFLFLLFSIKSKFKSHFSQFSCSEWYIFCFPTFFWSFINGCDRGGRDMAMSRGVRKSTGEKQ